jgi:hypothetical protein
MSRAEPDGVLAGGPPSGAAGTSPTPGGGAERPATSARAMMSSLVPSLGINAGMPFVTYLFLTGRGMGTVPALALGGLRNVLEI